MKKHLTKSIITLLALGLLSSALIGCGKGSGNPFSKKSGDFFDQSSKKQTGESSVPADKSSSKATSSANNGNNSGGNNGTSDELTFDEDSTKFGHSFSGTGAGEVAIQVNSENCKDDDLIIPSKYVDAKGNKYQVTMDYGNGFSYLSAQKITLPDGFKEIHVGFDMCMYVKRIYLPKTITKLYNEILTSCLSLTTIDFAGTKDEWNAIDKESRWNYKAPAFDVSCKDGIINVEKGPSD